MPMLTTIEIKRNSDALLKKQLTAMFKKLEKVEELPQELQDKFDEISFEVSAYLLEVQTHLENK
jgi:uncharacterized protein (UPF0335 family)